MLIYCASPSPKTFVVVDVLKTAGQQTVVKAYLLKMDMVRSRIVQLYPKSPAEAQAYLLFKTLNLFQHICYFLWSLLWQVETISYAICFTVTCCSVLLIVLPPAVWRTKALDSSKCGGSIMGGTVQGVFIPFPFSQSDQTVSSRFWQISLIMLLILTSIKNHKTDTYIRLYDRHHLHEQKAIIYFCYILTDWLWL